MALGLGVLGLLCAALGVIMILMVPSLIKQQVLKVSEGSWGGEDRDAGWDGGATFSPPERPRLTPEPWRSESLASQGPDPH